MQKEQLLTRPGSSSDDAPTTKQCDDAKALQPIPALNLSADYKVPYLAQRLAKFSSKIGVGYGYQSLTTLP